MPVLQSGQLGLLLRKGLEDRNVDLVIALKANRMHVVLPASKASLKSNTRNARQLPQKLARLLESEEILSYPLVAGNVLFNAFLEEGILESEDKVLQVGAAY